MSKALEDGLSDSECADKLAEWECLLLILLEMVTVAPELSSVQLTISWNKSAMAPVGWFPLHAYPVTYFSVASIFSIRRSSPSHKPN
jgi:precorrin-6B methylase 1